MAVAPAVNDIEQLKSHPAVMRLVSWNSQAIEGAKFDREEMTLYIGRSAIREACALLRDDAGCPFNYLSDVTCVDWYPSEPRFEVVYHLLSIANKERVRLKVRLSGDGRPESASSLIAYSGSFLMGCSCTANGGAVYRSLLHWRLKSPSASHPGS